MCSGFKKKTMNHLRVKTVVIWTYLQNIYWNHVIVFRLFKKSFENIIANKSIIMKIKFLMTVNRVLLA